MKQSHLKVVLLGAVGAFLISISNELGAAHSWGEVMQPGFVGTLLRHVAPMVAAVAAALKIDT